MKIITKGMIGCKGIASGKAHHIEKIEDMNSFKQGSILIIQHSSPMLTPVLVKASAIISETGSTTSHLAIVAREFNLPCIVFAKDAMKLIPHNKKILVNANEGIIYG